MNNGMLRGTPALRLTPALFGSLMLALGAGAVDAEETQPWMRYEAEFRQLHMTRATAKRQEAAARNDAAEEARWQRRIDEVSGAQATERQLGIREIEVVDYCVTCHRGIDDPLFQDAPQPFRTHPGEMLEQHEITAFACTPCHDGQGAAMTADAAHGKDAGWPKPMLPAAYLQASCARCHEVTHGAKGAELISRGADVFVEKGCSACHDARGVSDLPKFGPPLASLKSKLSDPASWVYAWIKDPAAIASHTMMPKFELDEEKLGRIAAFLLSRPADKTYEPVALGGAAAKEGERLFTERGCRGCHGVKSDEQSASPRVPHLAGVGSKVTPEWLDRWIADPKEYNPDTAMPKLDLKDDERHAVTAYLLTLKRAETLPAAPDLGRFNPEDGKELVKRYECFGCHAIPEFEKIRPSVPDLAEFARRPLKELDFGPITDVPRTRWDWLARKLAEPRAFATEKTPLVMPAQAMSDEERQALVVYVLAYGAAAPLARYAVPATPQRRAWRDVSWMLGHFTCPGCHRVTDRDPPIARFFERKNLVPPTLENVGARLQGKYMYEFLKEPKPVRPWLTMRMPTFGFSEAQVKTLVDGFAAMANVENPHTYVANEDIAPDHFERGFRRFSHYQCVQCHPTSIDQGLPEDVDPEDLSINLMLTKTRLRSDWVKEFMERPKEIAGSDTRMPTVFYTVDGEPKVERPTDDIDDITTYLMGMVEPPEVTLKAQAEVRKAEQEKGAVDWTQVEY